MSSKRYPEEFDIESVKQVTDRGHPAAEVASRLGCRCRRGMTSSSAIARRRPSAANCRGWQRRFGGSRPN